MNEKAQRYCFLLFLTALFFFFAGSGLESQQKGAQKELQHEVAVTLKLIQVFVTDQEGNPVTDLAKEDFSLWDNGEQRKITDFETHFTILRQKAPPPDPAVEEPEKEEPPASPIQLNRKFFLFLDIQRNDPIGMIKSKRAARYFVETQIQPGDEVGILSFQPSAGFVLHEYLTPDKGKMFDAIRKARALPVYSLMGGVSGGGGQSSGASSGGAEGDDTNKQGSMSAGLAAPDEGPSWSALAQPLNVFFFALEDLSQTLQYVQGIKNIILFSAGASAATKQIFDVLGKRLASSNCRVYTVDTNWKFHYLKGYFESGRGSALKQLAVSSGGKHFEDPDDFVTIAEDIQMMTGNYYVLGYYIEQEWDGQYHEVRVEVRRKNCEVFAQKGYFNPKPFSEFTEAEKKLHLADITMSDTPYFESPEPFLLEALAFPGKEVSKLVLLSEIRPINLEEVFSSDAEVITLVYDEEKNIYESGRSVIKKGSIKQTPIHFYTITRLTPGSYECRIVVRNLETGKSALGTSSVVLPEYEESDLRVSPLFLLIPEKESFYMRAVKEEKRQMNEALSLNDLYPYLSKNFSPLVGEVDRSEKKLLAVLRFFRNQTGQLPIDTKVELVHGPSGRIYPLEHFLLESKKFGLDEAILLEIGLPYTEPDVYTLTVAIRDPQSDLEAAASRTFRIR